MLASHSEWQEDLISQLCRLDGLGIDGYPVVSNVFLGIVCWVHMHIGYAYVLLFSNDVCM